MNQDSQEYKAKKARFESVVTLYGRNSVLEVLEDNSIEIIKTQKATIQTDIPISFQIDGEFCGQVKKLDIEMESQKIKIATPK